MRPARRHLRALATTALAVLAPLTPLAAADPPVPVTFTPIPVAAGEQAAAHVDAPGLDPRDFRCTVTFDKTDVKPGCAPVAGITVSVTFTVPKDASGGTHVVTMVVNTTTYAGTVEVTPPSVDEGTLVPDVRLAPRARAVAAVTRARLEWCPTGQDSGFVLRQDPAPTTRVPSGSCVTVTLADNVVVPNLVGRHPDEARSLLSAVLLTLIAPDGDGTITGQDPPAGAPLPENGLVTVTFAVVPPAPPPPPPPPPLPSAPAVTSGATATAEGSTQPPVSAPGVDAGAPAWPTALVAAVVVVAALAASTVYRNRLRRRPSAALEVHAKPDQHEQVRLLDESSLTGAGVRATARRDDDVLPVLLEDLR